MTALIITAFLAAVVPAPHAAAVGASTCGTGYVYMYNVQLKSNSSVNGLAKLYVYRNANKTKMCALTIATGAAYGVVKPMSVSTEQYGPSPIDIDSGNFAYYAGPVYGTPTPFTGTACTSTKWFQGYMRYKNVDYFAHSKLLCV